MSVKLSGEGVIMALIRPKIWNMVYLNVIFQLLIVIVSYSKLFKKSEKCLTYQKKECRQTLQSAIVISYMI